MEIKLTQTLDANALSAEIDAQGFCIVHGAISRADAARLKERLWQAAESLREAGLSTHSSILDPTAANVRIFDLPNHHPAFVDLLTRHDILQVVRVALGGDFLASNFTANIACPGSLPMRIHSDMALVFPEPWQQRWALNVIWCLDDISEANGATRYLPGSHRFSLIDELPQDADDRTVPFIAEAGSIIVMDGRLWHTSGSNRTADQTRAMMFAYYSRSFIRTQANWHELLQPHVVAALDDRQRQVFGFGPLANTYGSGLVLLGNS
jgi:fumagillin biosynthesis dioxygenase